MNVTKNNKKIINAIMISCLLFVWSLTPFSSRGTLITPKIQEVQAASPAVQSRGTGNTTSDVSSISVTLSGTPASGNLYFVFLRANDTTTTWSQNVGTTGWTELFDSNGQAGYYKQIGSNEPNPSFAVSVSDRVGYSVLQITGHADPSTQAPEVSTEGSGTNSNSPDPPSITPTGGSKDYLFIAVGGVISSRRQFTTAPTNYSNLNAFVTNGGSAGTSGATAERQLTASSEDPGVFTLDGNDNWFTRTVAIHPAAATPTDTPTPTPTTAGTPTFTQNDFEWFVNADSTTLTDPWGNPDLGENTDITAIPATNNPPKPGDKIRLQINLTVGTANLSASTQAFKLQFKTGTDQDCSTGSWTDVGAKASSSVAWRFFDNASLSDNSTNDVNQISTSDVAGGYSEVNPTQTNPNAVNVGEDFEWDFPIESVEGQVASATSYAFRMVKSDGTTINYTSGDCPTIETSPDTGDLMRHGKVFIDGSEKGMFWAN